MDPRIVSFRAALDGRRLSGFQYRLIGIALLLLLTDGYDNYAVGYVVPVLSKLWHVEPSSFGAIFSAGIIGLTVGAMICSPISDRFGARRVLLACTAMYAILTLGTALAPSWGVLLILRFITGLALGGAMPSAVALVSEYSPSKVRNFLVAIAVCGFALGGVVGGLVAAATVSRFGWETVFILGGVVPLAMLPLLSRWLPESLPALLADRPPYTRLRQIVAKIVPGWEPPLPSAVAVETQRFPVRQLFAPGYVGPTLLIWLAFVCNLLLLYFLSAWLPSVVHGTGRSLELANLTTSLYQAGGIVGALILAFLCDRTGRPQPVLACAFLGAAACCVALGQVGSDTTLLMISAAGAGFCVVGGQIAGNAFVGNYYPSAARATGVGWALGIGRLGSIAGPLLGGALIGLKVSTPVLFTIFAIPALLGSLSGLLVKRAPEDIA